MVNGVELVCGFRGAVPMGPSSQKLASFASGLVQKRLESLLEIKQGGAKAGRYCHEKHFFVTVAKGVK